MSMTKRDNIISCYIRLVTFKMIILFLAVKWSLYNTLSCSRDQYIVGTYFDRYEYIYTLIANIAYKIDMQQNNSCELTIVKCITNQSKNLFCSIKNDHFHHLLRNGWTLSI